jgi:hypothetical protein
MPKWLQDDYLQAIRGLAEIGAREVLLAKDPDEIRAILSILALAADARTHARFLLNYSDKELEEMEQP